MDFINSNIGKIEKGRWRIDGLSDNVSTWDAHIFVSCSVSASSENTESKREVVELEAWV